MRGQRRAAPVSHHPGCRGGQGELSWEVAALCREAARVPPGSPTWAGVWSTGTVPRLHPRAPSSASVVSPRARTPSPPRAAPVSSFSLLRGSWERSTGSLVSCTQKSGRGRCRGAPAGWSFLAVPRASVHHCHSLPKAGLLLWCAAARLTQSYTWSQPS